MRWIGKLGYGGRADRREFAAGAALTVIGPMVLSMAIAGSIKAMFATLPEVVALILALLLTAVVCAAIVGWFWLWSVLLTRRARDVGLPAWSGVASVMVVVAVAQGLEGLAPPAVARLAGAGLLTVWFLVWAVWPGAGRPFLPRRQPGEASAAA